VFSLFLEFKPSIFRLDPDGMCNNTDNSCLSKMGRKKTCLPVEKEKFCRLWGDSVSVTDIKTL
jgi:hypothetical protein